MLDCVHVFHGYPLLDLGGLECCNELILSGVCFAQGFDLCPLLLERLCLGVNARGEIYYGGFGGGIG